MISSPDVSRPVSVQVMVHGPLALVDEPACPHCGRALERHQPDLDRTESMLGTCLDCGDWFVLVHDTKRGRMWMTHLPLGHLRTGLKPAKRRRQAPSSELRAG